MQPGFAGDKEVERSDVYKHLHEPLKLFACLNDEKGALILKEQCQLKQCQLFFTKREISSVPLKHVSHCLINNVQADVLLNVF